jgi:hypothetical protein
MSRLVVIPWRPAPSRIDAFERVVAWYERTLPEFEIRTLDTDDDTVRARPGSAISP